MRRLLHSFSFLVAALIYLAATSHLIPDLAAIPAGWNSSYSELRILNGFDGMRIDSLELGLNRVLPRSQAVRLSPDLLSSQLLNQRISEGLYPRRVAIDAPFELGRRRTQPVAEVRPGVFAFLDPESSVRIPDSELSPPSVFEPPAVLAFFLVVILGAAAAGLGLLLVRKAGFAEAVVAGYLVIGIVWTAATMLQLAVPRLLLPGAGLLLLLSLWRPGNWKRFRPARESWALLGFFGLLLMVMLSLPASHWDARSLWLFRAKQLAFEGHYAAADFNNAAYGWSHRGYPLFFPAWLAWFSQPLSYAFSERSAALGAFTLFAALGSMVWERARRLLGRETGALLSALLLAGTSGLVATGLADGFVMLFLAAGYLCLRLEARSIPGWICLACAALTKWEGFLLAPAVLLAVAFAGARMKVLGPRALAAATPAIVYLVWMTAQGMRMQGEPLGPGQVAGEFLARVGLVLASVRSSVLGVPFLGVGALALISALFLMARKKIAAGAPAMLPATFSLAFAAGAFLFSSYDLEWHLSTAMHRLLIHSAAFALLAYGEISGNRSARPT